MKFLEFALQQEKPKSGEPDSKGFVALWIHAEGLQQYAVFRTVTTHGNHEGLWQVALALRDNYPMTMPGHFEPLYKQAGFQQETT